MSRSPCDRLLDIIDRIDAATKAEILLARAEANFDHPLAAALVDSILFDLLVIGEATKALPAEWKKRRDDVPWSLAAKLRDRLAHHYFAINLPIIRTTLDTPLAVLREACTELQRFYCAPRIDGGEEPRVL